MKQLREHWSWSSAIAPLVFGVALAVVVTSCGKADSPAAPSGLGSPQALAQTDPVPDPSPDPSPEPSPTPPGGQGCTPGYWKQTRHFDSWVGYAPGQSFLSVFGVDAFPGMSLLDVLSLGGAGLNALGRHTVAALLNATNPDVASGMTSAQVIAAFNAAYASGSYETLKNTFDTLNNQGCPLD